MHGVDLPQWLAEMTSALDDKMGLELLEVSAERTVGRIPVEGNTQVIGLLHGGASGVLTETLGSMAAQAHAREHGGIAVGLNLEVTHHRAVRNGHVTGTATALHLGRTICTHLVEIVDDEGDRVATGRLTCLVRPRPSKTASA